MSRAPYEHLANVLSCPCCGHQVPNDDVLTAAMTIYARITEEQRRMAGHYKRRPSTNTKEAGFTEKYYEPVYGRYTPKQKQEAVDLVARIGVRAAARETGIPKSTLSDWAQVKGPSD